MCDTNFFKNSSNLKKKITENLLSQKDAEVLALNWML